MEVRLHEAAAECAQPTDQIVRLDVSLILEVNEIEHDFASIFQIELLIRQ